MNYFENLQSINCNDKTEKKNNLTYLSWAFAWSELKKRHPLSFYTVYENRDGLFYHTDGNTAWVKTGVTVVLEDGTSLEHIEYLPVMDYKNKSIPVEALTSFDVNKTIQRSLTKAVARHGLGLYIYAGEDVPNESDGSVEERIADARAKKVTKAQMEENKRTELSKSEQEGLKAMCKQKGADFKEVCMSVGWVSGTPFTKEHYGLAMNALMALKDKEE